MSNKNQLDVVVARSFELADRIVSNTFDYGDGTLQRKRTAIALNLISRAADGVGIKEMWTSNMLDDSGKENILNGLKGKPTHEADDVVRPIWDHMDDKHKQIHLENHPESGFHVVEGHRQDAADQAAESEVEEQQQQEENHEELRQRHKRRNRNKRLAKKNAGSEGDTDDDWWNKMSLTEQKQYLRKHPKSKKARRWRIGIRNLAKKATSQIHEQVRQMGHDYRTGMDGIRAMREGKKMTDEQKEALKKVAQRVSKLLLGALTASVMFSPLGGFAMEIGAKYTEAFDKGRSKELADDHENRRFRREDGVEVDRDGVPLHPTTVGQTGGAQNGSGSETTVGQTAQAHTSQSGVNLKFSKKKHAENQRNEMELDWMRRDMVEWLMNQDTEKLAKQLKEEKARKSR